MPISQDLIALLVCPESRTPLRRAPEALIERINGAIDAGRLRNRAGNHLTERVVEALVREDSVLVYLVRDGIPNLLIDESLELDKIA